MQVHLLVNGKSLDFNDTSMNLAGREFLYSKMDNIAHRGGEKPAFLFDYEGKRLALSYDEKNKDTLMRTFQQIVAIKKKLEEEAKQAEEEEADFSMFADFEVDEPKPAPSVEQEAPTKSDKHIPFYRKKRFLIPCIIIIFLIIVIAIGSCQSDSDGTASNQATIENPADPTQKISIEDLSGTYSIQLDNTYVGDNALDFLVSIGENRNDFSEPVENNYKLVVQEYTVSADKGYESEAFSYTPGNEIWDVNHESTYDYYSLDLYENASLNYSQLTLENGESSKMYVVFELPENIDRYISSVSGADREYWFTYDVSE